MAHGGGELERAVAVAQAGLSALEKLERLDAERARDILRLDSSGLE
jgi:hypothetical protein